MFDYFCSWFCLVFAISFACFAMSFYLIFAANICVYFQYPFMRVVCANIFGANVLKLRFNPHKNGPLRAPM